MDWITYFAGLVSSIVVAIIATITTTHLAIRRHRSVNWWNKKGEAYLKAIDILNALRMEATEECMKYMRENHGDPIPDYPGLPINNANYGQIKSLCGTSPLLISKEVANLLSGFIRDVEQLPEKSLMDSCKTSKRAADRFYEHDYYWEQFIKLVDSCVLNLSKMAEKDLKVR